MALVESNMYDRDLQVVALMALDRGKKSTLLIFFGGRRVNTLCRGREAVTRSASARGGG